MNKRILVGLFCFMAVIFSGLAYANPVITAIPNQVVNEGSLLTVSITSTAPNNGGTVWSLLSFPSGATLANVSDTQATFSYTPGDVTTSSIQFPVTVQASDADSSDVKSFIVTVNDVSQPSGNLSKLEIVDLDVKVGSNTDKNVDNNSKISEEGQPGDSVTFSIEIKNIFDEDVNDTEIKDVSVTVTIFGIDDGDDLDEDSDEFDLDAEEKDTVDIDFEIPMEVEEGIFDVEIRVEGEDEFDNKHELVWELQIEVEKDDHKIMIRDATLNPSSVQCARDATLDVNILNIGSKDEDEVVLEIRNSDLGINVRDTDLELDEGIDDNDYSKTVSIDATGAKAGNYPVTVKTYYDTSKQSDSKTLTLTVQECAETKPVVVITPPEEEEEDEEEVEVVTVPPVTTGTVPVTAQPVAPTTFAVRDTTTYTAILIILIVIIVILLVFAIVSIIRRR